MHRRNFLKIGGLTLLGIVGSACGKTLQGYATKSRQKRIVVIGAGLSGLTAAQELQRNGYDVIVVEARERIGGRIWTSTQWENMPLDLGASWIHGPEGNPITELAEQLGAKRIVTSYDRAITYNTSGQLLTRAEAARMEQLRTQVFQALQVAQNADTDTSIRQAIAPLIQQFDRGSEAHRFVNFILNSEIEQEYSGSAEHLSSHWYDSAQAFAGEDVLFAQGFKVIPEFLAQELNINFGQVVQEIQWQRSPVRVITQTTEFSADHVVVTLPLGVLQANRVRFSPELPDYKQHAITKLGMGVLNKCYLQFPDVFWDADVDWLEYIPARHGEWVEWVSFKPAANLPVLLGFNAAEQGRAIEAWSNEKIVASAMQTLKTIYGVNIPEPTNYQITRWATDPFALGSYSYNPSGAIPSMRQDLAIPLENLVFFAGEASHQDYFGTTHGAYLSGLRAAQEILDI